MAGLIAGESIALIMLGVLVLGLLRSHAAVLRKLHELGLDVGQDGSPNTRPTGPSPPTPHTDELINLRVGPGDGLNSATDITGRTLQGGTLAISMTNSKGLALVAFLSGGCSTCRDFWDSFRDPGKRVLPGSPRIVIVTRDESTESPGILRSLAPGDVQLVMSNAAWEEYRVPGAPYFVMVDCATGKKLGEGTTKSWSQLRDLIVQSFVDYGGDRFDNQSPLGPKDRESRADWELARNGILPGDPSLYNPAIGTFQDARNK